MIALGLMALIGALLGARVRPRLVGVLLAIGLAAGFRSAVAMFAPEAVDNIRAPIWAQWSLAVAVDPLDGYLALLAVCGGAALISAVLGMVFDRRPAAARSVVGVDDDRTLRGVRGGRYQRAAGMVEERPLQAKAEARQKELLGL
jgi:hypothetical protein